MSGTFKSAWKFIPDEIYRPFVQYDWPEPIPEGVFVALSGELILACEKTIGSDVWIGSDRFDEFRDQVELIETEEHKNNAYELFSEIVLPDFIPDLALILYFENIIDLLHNDYDDSWGYVFADLVGDFIKKFNLGYRMTQDYKILPLLTGEIKRIYDRISLEQGPHNDLQALWRDFEEEYASLVKGGGDCKSPLAKGIMYLEAIASDFGGEGRSAGFSKNVALFEGGEKFPHKGSIKKSITNLYGLSSDYPGIRHPGNPASKNRELNFNDASHIGIMFFIWAGYMHSLRDAA